MTQVDLASRSQAGAAPGTLAAGTASSSLPPGQVEVLQRALAEFGLNGYQTRVLLALLRYGAAPASQLAWFAEVPRTGVYPVLHALSALGLAAPERGPSKRWTAPARDELLARLRSVGEEQLREEAARKELAHRKLVSVLPEPAPADTANPIQVLESGQASVGLYARCLAAARTEVLVFNRGPYFGVGDPNPAVLEMLARGVATRALYQAADLVGPQGEGLTRETDAYVEAGVEARVVEELPLKLALFDNCVALLPLEDPSRPLAENEPHLHVTHRGFAAFAKAAFEHHWSVGQLYLPQSRRNSTGTVSTRSSHEAEGPS